VRALRHELHLDEPLPLRYGRWLFGAVSGDLGESYRNGEPVLTALARRFPRTLSIALLGLGLALLVAVPLGIVSAVRQGSSLDHTARIGTLLLGSLPSYWLGYLLILLFAVALGILPVAGWGTPKHLVLPALTLALGIGASLSRFTRATILEELAQGYVRTALAKGMGEWSITIRHCLRNALVGLITVTALRFGHLLGGAVIVETVFAIPGIGSLAVDAIFDRDYPVIQGFVLFTGTIFLLLNLFSDLAYTWLDPRIDLVDNRSRVAG